MKKLSKILLSICMTFVMAFALVGCDESSDPNGSQKPAKYTPPAGVDMTSVSEYALWLMNSSDRTSSYIASVTDYMSGTTPVISFEKYQYENGVQKFASYDAANKLSAYKEYEKITSEAFTEKNYNITNLTYTSRNVDKKTYLKDTANLRSSQSVPGLMWQIEINNGYDFGQNKIDEISGYEDISVSESVQNPETGKYILTRSFKQNDKEVMKFVVTCENNKVTKMEEYGFENNALKLMAVISYEYKAVVIDLTTESYTPPVGVNMTSVSEYALWLMDNADRSESYVATVTDYVSSATPSVTIQKYKYENGVEKFASYGSSNQLSLYKEYAKITADSYTEKTYDVSALTFSTNSINKNGYLKSTLNAQSAQSIPGIMWQIEVNSGFNFGENKINQIQGYENITVTETVENPETGKYILTRAFKLNGDVVMKYVITCQNNKVTKVEMYSIGEGSELKLANAIVYEYKEVVIDIQTSLYTPE